MNILPFFNKAANVIMKVFGFGVQVKTKQSDLLERQNDTILILQNTINKLVAQEEEMFKKMVEMQNQILTLKEENLSLKNAVEKLTAEINARKRKRTKKQTKTEV